LTDALEDASLDLGRIDILNTILHYFYPVLVVMCFLLALGNRPQGSKFGYTLAATGLAVITVYMTVVDFVRAFRGIGDLQNDAKAGTNPIFRSIVHPSLLACADIHVARETSPEAIATLEQRKLQLQVEIHALSHGKDNYSRERLKMAPKAMAALRAAYELENQRGKEIANVRRRIDELRAKADEAERRYDLETASDLRYYAIPDLRKCFTTLETALEEKEAKKGA
jgi:hypothetical protein